MTRIVKPMTHPIKTILAVAVAALAFSTVGCDAQNSSAKKKPAPPSAPTYLGGALKKAKDLEKKVDVYNSKLERMAKPNYKD